MKKTVVYFLVLAVAFAFSMPFAKVESVFALEGVTAKGACLIDGASGEVVFEKDGDKKLEIASMTKIMTLLVIFDDYEKGVFNLDDEVPVSDRAQGMGGSQVFLSSKCKYPAKELIKSIIICSANDSCVAFAEFLTGSEESFVEKMNEKAKVLKLENTHFSNCTGLPAPSHYSSAKDVAVMLKELTSHKEYFDYSKIWLTEISHEGERVTEMANTNKLLRSLNGCDGGKTGYTSSAGHCIAATAKRGDTRLISVIVGANASKERFKEAAELINYGFANFESVKIIEGGKELEFTAPVLRGKEKSVTIAPKEDYLAFTKKREAPDEIVNYELNEKLTAPIKKGDEVGFATVNKGGVEVKRIPLVATLDVAKRGLFDGVIK